MTKSSPPSGNLPANSSLNDPRCTGSGRAQPSKILYLNLGIEKTASTETKRLLSNEGLVVEEVPTAVAALNRLSRGDYSGVYLEGGRGDAAGRLIRLLQNDRILNGMPEGVALVNADMRVTWANSCLREWSPLPELIGHNFYAILGNSQILGPDFCPFHTALATGNSSNSTLQTEDNKFYQVHVAPLVDASTDDAALVATISDVTAEILQHQKLAAIHQAVRS